MHVKGMVAPTPHRRAIVPRNVAIWTACLKSRVANAAALVVHVPSPGGHAMPSMWGYVGREEGRRSVGMDTHTRPAARDTHTRPTFLALIYSILSLPLSTALGNTRPPTTRTF